MRAYRATLAATLLMAVALPAPAAAVPADFKARADAYLAATYPANEPGGAFIVVDKGKIVYAAGRGIADMEQRTPITPDTLFRIASNTKQFTAATILKLVEDGKLSLDDPLSKFLPDYPQPGARATVAQLLNHQSGIKNFTTVKALMIPPRRSQPITTEELIAGFKDEPGDFAPGERYLYNNSGYALLGAIIEKVTGQPWYEVVQQRLLAPLDLKDIRHGVAAAAAPAMAKGYAKKDGKVVAAPLLHMSAPHAAGSMVASVKDMARWATALHHGRVLRPTSYARMITPNKLPSGKPTTYGFGLSMGELRGRPTIGHGGTTAGANVATTFMPNEDLFVAVFTNSNHPPVKADIALTHLAGLAIGEPYPQHEAVPIAAAEVEPMFGTYRVEGGERLFYRRDDRLFTRRSGSSEQEVFAAGSGKFFYGPASLTWFEMSRDPGGALIMTSYSGRNQESEIAPRIGPMPAGAANAPNSAATSAGEDGGRD